MTVAKKLQIMSAVYGESCNIYSDTLNKYNSIFENAVTLLFNSNNFIIIILSRIQLVSSVEKKTTEKPDKVNLLSLGHFNTGMFKVRFGGHVHGNKNKNNHSNVFE